jgi:Flp pilus assembly protein TadG
VWVIASVPALLALLILVTEIANLWLARIELGNAVEAGALAGALVWGDGADDGATRALARTAAQAFAQANTVVGSTIAIGLNDNGTGQDNQQNNNQTCTGNILLGQLSAGVLQTSAANPIVADQRACRVQATVAVNSLWTGLFTSPWSVQANATAQYDSVTGTARLTQVTSVVCP